MGCQHCFDRVDDNWTSNRYTFGPIRRSPGVSFLISCVFPRVCSAASPPAASSTPTTACANTARGSRPMFLTCVGPRAMRQRKMNRLSTSPFSERASGAIVGRHHRESSCACIFTVRSQGLRRCCSTVSGCLVHNVVVVFHLSLFRPTSFKDVPPQIKRSDFAGVMVRGGRVHTSCMAAVISGLSLLVRVVQAPEPNFAFPGLTLTGLANTSYGNHEWIKKKSRRMADDKINMLPTNWIGDYGEDSPKRT